LDAAQMEWRIGIHRESAVSELLAPHWTAVARGMTSVLPSGS
jgi:hypothetical protein